MDISLEKIDVLRERANISYKEAKEILEKYDGDLIESLIYLEENKKTLGNSINKTSEQIVEKLKAIIKKGNVTKIVLKKDDEILMNIPVTAGAIGVVLGPFVAAAGVAGAILTKCTIEITKENGEVVNINEIADDTIDRVKDVTGQTIDKVKDITEETVEKVKNFNKNNKDKDTDTEEAEETEYNDVEE